MEVNSMLSEKGNKLLLLNNYKFSKGYVAKCGKIQWRCVNRKCSSKIYTAHDEITVLNTIINHNHAEDCTIFRQVVSNGIKRKAYDLTENPSKLIHKELKNNDVDITAAIISKDLECIRRNVYIKRRNILHSLPKSQNDMFDTSSSCESNKEVQCELGSECYRRYCDKISETFKMEKPDTEPEEINEISVTFKMEKTDSEPEEILPD